MKRRKFVAGLAGLTGAGAIGFGTGAFSNTTVQRKITIETEDDRSAVLALNNRGSADGGRSQETEVDGTDLIEFHFPGDNGEHALNTDAVIQYGTESGADIPGLFDIKNEGTEPIELSDRPAEEPNSEEPRVGIFDVNADQEQNGRKPLLRDDNVVLEPGDLVGAGIEINTYGVDPGEVFETHVYIRGKDPEDNG